MMVSRCLRCVLPREKDPYANLRLAPLTTALGEEFGEIPYGSQP